MVGLALDVRGKESSCGTRKNLPASIKGNARPARATSAPLFIRTISTITLPCIVGVRSFPCTLIRGNTGRPVHRRRTHPSRGSRISPAYSCPWTWCTRTHRCSSDPSAGNFLPPGCRIRSNSGCLLSCRLMTLLLEVYNHDDGNDRCYQVCNGWQ